MMKKALLVIDMQQITVGQNHSAMFNYPIDLVSNINDFISITDADVVIYIKNLMKDNFINKFAPIKCFKDSKESELVSELNIISNNIFDKYKGDAFSNIELVKFLKANSIDEVELIGVDGGGCVSLTAFGAIKSGYKVILNNQYIGTIFEKRKCKFYNKLKKMGVVFK